MFFCGKFVFVNFSSLALLGLENSLPFFIFFLNPLGLTCSTFDIFTMFNAKLILTLMGSLSVHLLSVVDAFLTVTDIILGTPVLPSLAFAPFFLLRLPSRSLTKFLFLVQ